MRKWFITGRSGSSTCLASRRGSVKLSYSMSWTVAQSVTAVSLLMSSTSVAKSGLSEAAVPLIQSKLETASLLMVTFPWHLVK
ncbi:hypothetical protein J6590_064232 [Homalodisca vitripennis]|nr:hypothetical protein J6590_064232 [Homalodisca vitripennis]